MVPWRWLLQPENHEFFNFILATRSEPENFGIFLQLVPFHERVLGIVWGSQNMRAGCSRYASHGVFFHVYDEHDARV